MTACECGAPVSSLRCSAGHPQRPSRDSLLDAMSRVGADSELGRAMQTVMWGLKHDGRNRDWYERNLAEVVEHMEFELAAASCVAFRPPTRRERLADELAGYVGQGLDCPPHLLYGYSCRGTYSPHDPGDEHRDRFVSYPRDPMRMLRHPDYPDMELL